MTSHIYDLIIIGSGPAGLAAAVYAQIACLATRVIEQSTVSGGQILNTYEVDNYPGWSLHGIRHRFRSLTELSFCSVLFEVVKRGIYLLFYHLCTFPFIGRILCHSLYFFR